MSPHSRSVSLPNSFLVFRSIFPYLAPKRFLIRMSLAERHLIRDSLGLASACGGSLLIYATWSFFTLLANWKNSSAPECSLSSKANRWGWCKGAAEPTCRTEGELWCKEKGCESQGTMRKRVVLGTFRARLSSLCQTSRDCDSYQSRPPEEILCIIITWRLLLEPPL